ncbi:MAG: serine kinase [Pseudomonadota bacterium]
MSGRGELLHASAVEAAGRALLILGPSGAGKSALAIELIALGARLVADDLVALSAEGGRLIAAAPEAAPEGALGVVEARGLGLLSVPGAGPTPVALVLDLGREERARLPAPKRWSLLGASAPSLGRPPRLQPAALFVALRHGGPLDPEAPLAPRATSAQSALGSCATRAADGVFE